MASQTKAAARSAYNHFSKIAKPELYGTLAYEEAYQAWQTAEAAINHDEVDNGQYWSQEYEDMLASRSPRYSEAVS